MPVEFLWAAYVPVGAKGNHNDDEMIVLFSLAVLGGEVLQDNHVWIC